MIYDRNDNKFKYNLSQADEYVKGQDENFSNKEVIKMQPIKYNFVTLALEFLVVIITAIGLGVSIVKQELASAIINSLFILAWSFILKLEIDNIIFTSKINALVELHEAAEEFAATVEEDTDNE